MFFGTQSIFYICENERDRFFFFFCDWLVVTSALPGSPFNSAYPPACGTRPRSLGNTSSHIAGRQDFLCSARSQVIDDGPIPAHISKHTTTPAFSFLFPCLTSLWTLSLFFHLIVVHMTQEHRVAWMFFFAFLERIGHSNSQQIARCVKI